MSALFLDQVVKHLSVSYVAKCHSRTHEKKKEKYKLKPQRRIGGHIWTCPIFNTDTEQHILSNYLTT